MLYFFRENLDALLGIIKTNVKVQTLKDFIALRNKF